jgi:U4/U6.U5 tri-snRNP-associated protein 2
VPGVVGLNNLKGTDYANAVFHLLNAVRPLRELFLLRSSFDGVLLDKFALLLKKLWNYQQFKGSICPHEIMQAISDKSEKLYRIGKRSDPANFLVWLIDNLQKGLKKEKPSLSLSDLFQGTIKTSYVKGIKNSAEYESLPTKVESKPFTVIRLEFQERGIFNKIENHVEMGELMEYYLGKRGKIQGEGLLFMKITHFPKYLLIVFKRFYSNDYTVEKNCSQVLYSGQLEIEQHKYRLIGQICHQGPAEGGSFRAAVCHADRWFEVEDLLVTEVLKKQMLLGEPYIQLYELAD